MTALTFDVGELKDLLQSTRSDTAHVKRIVLACERDMEAPGRCDRVTETLRRLLTRLEPEEAAPHFQLSWKDFRPPCRFAI